MPAALVSELTAHGATKRFDHGQLIHLQHAASAGLSVVLAGRVRFGLYTHKGAFFLTGILGPGHCFGEATLFADRPRAYHAEAFGQTDVLAVSRPVFDRLYKAHPELAKARKPRTPWQWVKGSAAEKSARTVLKTST